MTRLALPQLLPLVVIPHTPLPPPLLLLLIHSVAKILSHPTHSLPRELTRCVCVWVGLGGGVRVSEVAIYGDIIHFPPRIQAGVVATHWWTHSANRWPTPPPTHLPRVIHLLMTLLGASPQIPIPLRPCPSPGEPASLHNSGVFRTPCPG